MFPKSDDQHVSLETLARLNEMDDIHTSVAQRDHILEYMEASRGKRLYYDIKYLAGFAKDFGYVIFLDFLVPFYQNKRQALSSRFNRARQIYNQHIWHSYK